MILSIIASPLLWLARQSTHDRSRLEKALAWPLAGVPDRAQALERYLDYGTHHRDEVIDELLPKTRLDIAIVKGHVALRELLANEPNFRYKEQAEAELYKHLRAALRAYQAQTNPAHPSALAFMTKLLAYLERHSESTLKVVFTLTPLAQIEAIDQEMAGKLGAAADGLPSKPARKLVPLTAAFNEGSVTTLERAVASQLRLALSMIAHHNVLTAQLSDEKPAADSIEVDAQGKRVLKTLRFPHPTLLIDYTVRQVSTYTPADDPEQLAMTLALDFHVSLHIPGDEEPSSIDLSIPPLEPALKIPSDFLQSEPTSALYDRHLSSAFYRFTKALLNFFFDPSSPVGKRFELSAALTD